MRKGRLVAAWVICVLMVSAAPDVHAGETSPGGNSIYGQELMSVQEREAYRQQLWNFRTVRERNDFRERHRDKMQERARDKGFPPTEGTPWGKKGSVDENKAAQKGPNDGLRRWPAERSDGLQRLGGGAPEANSQTSWPKGIIGEQ